MKKAIFITTIFLLTHCSLLFAQGQPTPDAGERIKSMGQPSKWEFYLAPMALYDGDRDKWGGQLTGGYFRVDHLYGSDHYPLLGRVQIRDGK